MNKKIVIFTALSFFGFAFQTFAGTSIIPADRSIDWGLAGIPGGIPSASWPIYRALSPTGGNDDSAAIQSAINAAPAGSVILLNPGTYKLNPSSTYCPGLSATDMYQSGLCINKTVVLRGSGPQNTTLEYGGGGNIIGIGKPSLSASSVVSLWRSVTSPATKGSSQITLQNTSGISAGSYLVITQTNPNDSDGRPLVDTSGCSYCGHDMPNNAMTQIVKVTGVSGNTVTTEHPLYFTFSNSPMAYELSMIENAGLEDLRLVATAASGYQVYVFDNINMQSCAHCWVKNVESDMAVEQANMYLTDAYGCEVRNSYFNDGFSHESGESYAIRIEFRNSDHLIENNIVRRARHSILLAGGGSGNVIGYNYTLDAWEGPTTAAPNWLSEDLSGHGAHPFMNLWEGNVSADLNLDHIHGSSSHNTAFRNYISMTATSAYTGKLENAGLNAVDFQYQNNYENVIGNVLGPYSGTCFAGVYEINSPTAQNGSIYRFGYWDAGGNPNSSLDPAIAAKVGQTVLRGGNYDCVTHSTIWQGNVPSGSLASTYLPSQTLPASLYRTSKPAWFNTAYGNVTWPPIDPSAAIKVNKIPAQLCYELGPMIGAAFNPSVCYGATGTPQPLSPPTNLRVIP